MAKYTKEQIKKIVADENIRFIRLQFSDLLGILKNVEVPATQIDTILDGKVMFDGSSIEGFVRITESDMYLVPELDSFKILTWEKPSDGSQVGNFMCDIVRPSGESFFGDPRSVLKRALEKMESMGFAAFNIGLEPEFFLFRESEGVMQQSTEFTDLGGYFDISPLDEASDCRRDIVIELENMGFEIEASHHEVSQSQHEINFKYSNAIECADNVQLFKLAVKNIARKHGMYATFMPKPIAGINGSGMHANVSLFDKNGVNAFYDETGKSELSQAAYYFIGGLLKHAKSFTAVTNPTVNSYKRLVPGYEAPCYISYSDSNRSAMLRIPASRGIGTRVEVRSVDPTANPYLAIASILMAGLDGIENKIEPGDATKENIFAMTFDQKRELGIESLPESLGEAVKCLSESELMKLTLGEHTFSKFIANKQYEYDQYRLAVHTWELEKYLNTF